MPNRPATSGGLILSELPRRMRENGDAPALLLYGEGEPRRWTYAELADLALRLAAGLRADGLGAGERVVIFAPGSPAWLVACLGALAAGAVLAPIDHLLEGKDLDAVLEDADCRYVFTTAELLPRVAAHADKAVLLDGDEGAERGWRSLLAARAGEPAAADPDDVAVLFYTSGTTGRPKGVPLSNRNLSANIQTILALHILRSAQRIVLPLPFHHVYPFVVGLLAPLALGATIVVPSAPTPAEIGKALKEGEATMVIGVPRLYEALYAGIARRTEAAGPVAGAAFRGLLRLSVALRRRLGLRAGRLLFRRLHATLGPQLRYLVAGGARLDPDLEWRLEGLGWQVLTGYGLTETAAVAAFNPPGATRPGSAGRPAPGVEVRVSPRPGEADGEVEIRGENVFAGYRGRPEETAAALDAEGWFRTGDLGLFDDDGYLHISGRSKELIVLGGGKNVAPDEVEAVYGESPYVEEIAVLERKGGLVALVRPDVEALRASGGYRVEDTLRVSLADLGRRLAPYKRLSGYVLTQAALPRTRLGKLRRHLLPELYEKAKAGAAEPAAKGFDEADEALLAEPRARQVWELLEARFGAGAFGPDTSPQFDLELDSLAWTELVAEIEEATGVRLTDEMIAGVMTLRDLLRATVAAGAPAAADAPAARSLAEVEVPEEDARWLEPPGPLLVATGYAVHLVLRVAVRLFFRLRVEGAGRVPAEGPLVLASNHLSLLDPPLIFASLPWRRIRRTCWAADRQVVFENPLFRAAARLGRAFPVSDRKPVEALAMGARVLGRGEALVWFPEAWRSPTGELQPFRSGVGRLMAETGAPAVPVHIEGTFEALPRGRLFPRPRPVRLRFGAPARADELEGRGEGASPPARIAAGLHDAVAALAPPEPK